MRGKTAALAIVFVAVFVLAAGDMVMSALLERLTLSAAGTVKAIGVGVYWDSDCTNQVTTIDFGLNEPGSTKNVAVFVRNEGSSPAMLSFETENWNPSNATDYMSLTWDDAGEVIDVDEVVQVTLSLSVSNTIEEITNFSFDIVIIGSG